MEGMAATQKEGCVLRECLAAPLLQLPVSACLCDCTCAAYSRVFPFIVRVCRETTSGVALSEFASRMALGCYDFPRACLPHYCLSVLTSACVHETKGAYRGQKQQVLSHKR